MNNFNRSEFSLRFSQGKRLSEIKAFPIILLILSIFLIQSANGASSRSVKRGDIVKLVLVDDSAQIKCKFQEKGPDQITVYDYKNGLRTFDRNQIIHAFIRLAHRKDKMITGAKIGLLAGGAIATLAQWPATKGVYDKRRDISYEIDPLIIFGGVIGGAILGAFVGSLFTECVEVKSEDLFGNSFDCSPAKSPALFLSFKLRL